jgi:hypothetical protein
MNNLEDKTQPADSDSARDWRPTTTAWHRRHRASTPGTDYCRVRTRRGTDEMAKTVSCLRLVLVLH